MQNSGTNIRFQVLVNGEVRGTAGMDTLGVLSVIIDWVRRDPARATGLAEEHPEFPDEDWTGNKVHIRLGGLDTVTKEHVEWFGNELQVGDEVTVRVLAPGEYDPPIHRDASRECDEACDEDDKSD